MCIELYDHNKRTFEKIEEMWKTDNRVASVQPTGSGKSFLILKCAEKFSGKNIIILTSFNPIVEQFKKHDKGIEGIKYLTYMKLCFMSDEEITALNPDIIILDEFHHCGAFRWGSGTQRLLESFPNIKVFGTSATPIRYLDNERDMSDELFDGHLACNMSLSEAIVEEILPMPKYVSALYTFDEEAGNMIDKVNKSKNSDEEKLELIDDIKKLKHKLDKSKGVPKILKKHIDNPSGRYIVFCKGRDHLEEIKPVVINWFKKYFKLCKLNNTVNTYEVYSEYEDCDGQIELFTKDNTENAVKLLFCINMLNEGLHISNINGVILLRPTDSPTMYYQQIGRAIDAGRKDEKTLVLDLVNNFASIKSKSNTLKEDLEKTAIEHCNKSGMKEEEKKNFIDKFIVVDESCDVLNMFNEINDRLCDNWELYILASKQYIKREGHSNIPQKHIENINGNDVKLGQFRNTLMNGYFYIKEDRLKQLKEIGFIFEKMRKDFDFWFDLTVKFRKETGNANAIKNFMYNGFNLGHWQCNIRRKYKNEKLTSTEIENLKRIGFILDPHDYNWNVIHYPELVDYYNQYGNSDVPQKYNIDGTKLGEWVSHIRREYKNNKLTEEKINKLKQLEFNFVSENTNKKIICIETMVRFNSLTEAKEWCGLKTLTSICISLKHKHKSGGKHPETGEPLHWMYYDEYVKLYGEIEETKTA